MLKTDDVYTYVEQRTLKDVNFKESIISLYRENAKKVFPFYDFLARHVFIWLKPKACAKYFFLGGRFTDLIFSLPKEQVCIIGGPRQLIFCLKHNFKYLPNAEMWGALATGLTTKDDSHLVFMGGKYSGLIQRASAKKCNPVLIVENDSLPLQRFFCNVATYTGLKTVCIQHGLFQSKTEPQIIDGWKCDHFIVYDEKQKGIIASLGVDKNKMVIGGFYHPILPTSTLPLDTQSRKVCFLGQPWFRYGDKYKQKYIQLLDALNAEMKKINCQLGFKPHPWEKDAPYIGQLDNIFNGDMGQAIAEYDVFLSFTSTALLEVSLAGKVAIQIIDDSFESDDFNELGYAYSIKSDDLKKQLPAMLMSAPYPLRMPGFDCLVSEVKGMVEEVV